MELNKTVIRKLERHKTALAKTRDDLRELRDEIDGLLESSERGLAALEDAIDCLSELV